MYIIGLCGGIGAGKSTVAKILSENGFEWIDADKTAHEALGLKECTAELTDEFGDDILFPNGSVNRKALAEKAFASEENHQKLNNITHKYISALIYRYICDSNKKYVVIDAPLLFESGINNKCNLTVCVVASQKLRVIRASERDKTNSEKIEERAKKQLNDESLKQKCDYVIENEGSFEELYAKTIDFIKFVHKNGENTN